MGANPLFPNPPRDSDMVWDDITNSLIGRSLASVAGTVDYNWTENTVDFSANGGITDDNDCINFNVQYPHCAPLTGANAVLKLHIHWEQPNNTSDFLFTVRYRVQQNGAAKTTTWSEAPNINIRTGGAFTYTSGTLNQISPLVTINMASMGLSTTVQIRMTRVDALAGVVPVSFVDLHVAKDSLGSRQEYIK